MATQPGIRVSDAERQDAVDRLKAAHDEGRLDLLEYDRRLLLAYQAVTDRDLDQLFLDLPGAAPARAAVGSLRQVLEAAACRRLARPRPAPDLRLILRILWINYVLVVVVNVTVWLAVPGAEYFWPAWLLVPGIVLAGATAGVNALRGNRPAR